MEYLTLTEDEQHEMLVQTLASQERDHWMHTVNAERFEAILLDSTLTPHFRTRIVELLKQTRDRIHEVTQILEKLQPQLPPKEKILEVQQRLTAKAVEALAARRG